MRLIYTLLHYLAIPVVLIRLLWRSRHSTEYRKRLSERFGFIKSIEKENSIWIHAVSVGETIAAIPLIKALIQQYPQYDIVVTTTTPTGSNLVITNFNNEVHHVYAPFDTPTSVTRFLKRTRPTLCIIMETELWPNLFLICKKRGIPIILANGRLSERSSIRYHLIANLTKLMFDACHTLIAQGVLDSERYLRLGLDPNKLVISGNIKFDLHIPESVITEGFVIKKMIGNHRMVLIAASTHEGEENIILDAFERIRAKIHNLFLTIAPRHPDRFQKITGLCVTRRWKTISRSEKTIPTKDTDILIIDTIGELRVMYAASDIAFVGGSLVPIGGHNLIEPAAFGVPILTGPNLQNFTEISKLLQNAGAVQIVTDARSLADAVIALCSATELREKIGQCAKETIKTNRGALQKHLQYIHKCLMEKSQCVSN